MSITKITTHNVGAIVRLLYQYKESTNFQGLITGLFGTQIQELEDALWTLFGRLDIDDSEGEQLDGIGSIVGQNRMGLDDDLYQIWLKAKIAQNVSEGDIERVISIFRLFNPDATKIEVREIYPAEIDIYSNAAIDILIDLITENDDDIITENDNDLVIKATAYMQYIFNFMQQVVSAGVKVGYIAVFDPNNPFGFVGDSLSAGFGDTDDADVGGKFGYIELL